MTDNPLQYWRGFFVFPIMKTTTNQLPGTILALLAANIFSSKVLLVKWVYAQGLTPMEVLSLRMLAALPLFAFLTFTLLRGSKGRKPSWIDLLGMAGLGMIGYYLSSVLDFHGIQYISAGMERLLLYLYPSFLVLIRCLGERKKPGATEIASLILAYSGTVLVYLDEVSVKGSAPIRGSLLVLGAAFCFALYLYLSTHYIEQFGSRLFASYSTSVSCIAIIIHGAVVAERGLYALPLTAIWVCFAIGILCTFLATLAMHHAIEMIGSAKVGIIGTSGLLCPLVLGILLFNEPITINRVAGMVLVLVSVVALTLKRKG